MDIIVKRGNKLLSLVICHNDVVRRKQDSAPRSHSDRIIVEYTHSEHGNMLLTLGACNSRSASYTVFGTKLSGRRHPDVNDSRRLQLCPIHL